MNLRTAAANLAAQAAPAFEGTGYLVPLITESGGLDTTWIGVRTSAGLFKLLNLSPTALTRDLRAATVADPGGIEVHVDRAGAVFYEGDFGQPVQIAELGDWNARPYNPQGRVNRVTKRVEPIPFEPVSFTTVLRGTGNIQLNPNGKRLLQLFQSASGDEAALARFVIAVTAMWPDHLEGDPGELSLEPKSPHGVVLVEALTTLAGTAEEAEADAEPAEEAAADPTSRLVFAGEDDEETDEED